MFLCIRPGRLVMKIKILLFANLVLIGSAIALYVNRSAEPGVAAPAARPQASPSIPPETPPPWEETGSNSVPKTNATQINQRKDLIEALNGRAPR
jgi:hypothetical protein